MESQRSPKNNTFNKEQYPREKFPLKGKSKLVMWLKTHLIVKSLAKQKRKGAGIGYLFRYPEPEAAAVWSRFTKYNPNNLRPGNWLLDDYEPSGKIEARLMHQLINLYGGKAHEWDGYMTTGGTEGNIYLAWIGRNFLSKYTGKKPVLIHNSLTHFSITKAGDILGLETYLCPIGNKWSFDKENLITEITKLKNSGHESFLLPLTIGYTVTGTSDDIRGILNIIEKLTEKLGTTFFLWVDAALSGLVEPFISNDFFPLSSRLIRGLVVDFHKAGGVPYPAGVVLFQKGLQKEVESWVDYLNSYDNTLTCSRSGISAIVSWYMVNRWGRKGYINYVQKCLMKKKQFISKLSKYSNIEVITSPYSISCGIVSKNLSDQEIKNVESEYKIHFRENTIYTYEGIKVLKIARAYFL